MKLICLAEPEMIAFVASWVGGKIPHMNGVGFGPCASLAVVDRSNNLAAGLVFHSHQPQYGNIQMSFAAATPRWLTRRLATAILRYPFTQLGVQRVTAITPSDPTTSVWQFLTRFGFQKEGRVRKGLGTDDAIIWGLLASEWRLSRFNADRAVEHKRRRKGTLRLETHAIH